MSQRERWIVYPLLFFCFAMCIKLYWYPDYRQIKAKSVVCQSLLLQDEFERPLLVAGGQPSGNGYLFIYAAPEAGAAGQAPLQAVRLGVAANRCGVVETLSALGQPLVEVASDRAGGSVVWFDPTGRPLAVANTRGLALSDDPRAAPVRPPVPPAQAPTESPAVAVGSGAT